MKKIFYSILLGGLIWSISSMNVNAASYVNHKGVAVDTKIIEEFKDIVEPKQFDNMSQFVYDQYVFKYKHGYNLTSEIHVQRNLVKNGEILDTENYVMTEEEYQNYSAIEQYVVCDEGNACWQTDAKRIFLEVATYGGKVSASFYAIWLREPNVKGTDVIAMRHDGNIGSPEVEGIQYVDGPIENAIYYDNTTSNTQIFNNGVGISMNLKDDSPTFSLHLYLFGDRKAAGKIYASYQHGKNFTTVAESKQYTISSTGLGGVIKFNTSTISNKYDAMQGISYPF